MYNFSDAPDQGSPNVMQNSIYRIECPATEPATAHPQVVDIHTRSRSPRSTSPQGGIALLETQDSEAELPQLVGLAPRLALLPPDNRADEAADLEVQAKELLHLGDAYLMQGKVEPAIAHYRRALHFCPDLVDAHQGLAEALCLQGQLEEAATHYQKAIDLLPLVAEPGPESAAESAAELHQPGAELAIQSGTEFVSDAQPATASGSAAESAPVSSGVDHLPWYEQAAYYLQQGKAFCDRQQWQETLAACQQAAKLLIPQTAMTLRLIGRALQAEKQLEAAEQSYRKSLAIEPERAENHARIGSVLIEQQRLPEAVDCLQQAIAIDSKFTGVHLMLGDLWQQLGDGEQAADCLYQAYHLEPDRVTAKDCLQLGSLLLTQGKFEQAAWCYRQVIQGAPDSPKGYYNLAIALSKQSNWQEAVQYHQQAVERQPENPRLHGALGQAYMMTQQWNEAIAAYRQVTELMPDYRQLQEALTQMQQCQRAIVAESYGNVAASLAAKQQWQEAIECYEQAVSGNPQNVAYQVGLGQAYVATGQWEAAIPCYEAAIALQPDQPEHRVALAEALIKLGRLGEATQCYRRVVLGQKGVEVVPAIGGAPAPDNLDFAVL